MGIQLVVKEIIKVAIHQSGEWEKNTITLNLDEMITNNQFIATENIILA